MKAIIFNSGIGQRMGNLTLNNPKCMVKLYNHETIFERQIRILSECGIKDFIITTGPYEEQLKSVADKYKRLKFTFVKNPEYKTTNYIVSMNYAYDYLDSDTLLLHGDLVFNKELIKKVLNNHNHSVCLYNEEKELPDKDFKGRFKNNILKEVSINIFDNDCFTFQPLYKLSKNDIKIWKDKVKEFVNNGITNVYAENALNEITDNIKIVGMSYKDDFIEEIDNEDDYIRVSNGIKDFDRLEQPTIITNDYIKELSKYVKKNDKIFLVCGLNLRMKILIDFNDFHNITIFSAFTSNPKIEEVKYGVETFKKYNCNKIISIGGGSSIDVAKGIKYFLSNEDLDDDFIYNNIPHIAIPTTAGTGSEATEFAVIYKDNKKLSLDYPFLLPQVVILDYNFLKNLPDYQKKSTFLDSLSQAIESYWSRNANLESKNYSSQAINLILDNYQDYLNNKDLSLKNMLIASNLSGKAINITRTTAPHAMSYKLTSLYNISHGHAVSLSLIPCFKLLLEKSKTNKELESTLNDLAKVLKQPTIIDSINYLQNLITELNLPPINIKDTDLETLISSVNINRLNNNPIIFTKDELYNLYKDIEKEA